MPREERGGEGGGGGEARRGRDKKHSRGVKKNARKRRGEKLEDAGSAGAVEKNK